jgi:hypothetical protein
MRKKCPTTEGRGGAMEILKKREFFEFRCEEVGEEFSDASAGPRG